MENEGTGSTLLRRRWIVYFFMYWTAAISIAFQRQLTIHEFVGFAFVPFVVAHLLQRWEQFKGLLRQLLKVKKILATIYRKALNDLALVILTLGMLVSGIWDWRLGHPTRVRWHAIFGVLLLIDLLVHAFRRRRKIIRNR